MESTAATLSNIAEEDIESEAHEATSDVFVSYGFRELIPGCRPHPGQVVESGCLASIQLPRLTYQLDNSLPSELITSGKLSSLQLEGILYAAQAHQMLFPDGRRRGFFIGDAAGIGKGRQIAGAILLNYVRGSRKHIWFSISPELIVDAQRDLSDIGCFINVIEGCKRLDHETRAFGLSKEYQEGVVFSTYSTLVSSVRKTSVGSTGSRLEQLLKWCGNSEFDGCLIFDECHKAKHFVAKREDASTRVALAVMEIQRRLPKARVLYCSATGVANIKNMAYMDRLGLWGEGCVFHSFEHFLDMVQKKGLGVAEMLAMEMKASGSYVSRSLSYQNTEFEVVNCSLTPLQRMIYNRACHLWHELFRSFNTALTRCKQSGGIRALTFYWSAHQRFFQQLCQAMKVDTVIRLAKEALSRDCCVVIGLQATGEAALVHSVGHEESKVGDGNGTVKSESSDNIQVMDNHGLVSNCQEILLQFIENNFPTMIAGEEEHRVRDEWSCQARALLLQYARALPLPPTALDDVIHRLGGPEKVSEMTGRRLRLVRKRGADKFTIEARVASQSQDAKSSKSNSQFLSNVESVNIQERVAFMSGEKLVAIISDAASTGISLHADRSAVNQRRRVHITLELPWSAEKAVQQLGRSHRSNQACDPLYQLVTTELAGEHRFTAAVAKRLEYLGALTRGDRRAVVASGGMASFHIDTVLGARALRSLTQRLSLGLNRRDASTGGENSQKKLEHQLQLEFERMVKECPDFQWKNSSSNDDNNQDSQNDNKWEIGQWHTLLRDLFEKMGLLVKRTSVSAFDLVVQEGSLKISTFLNRLLGLEVAQQQFVFRAFLIYFSHFREEARLQSTGGLLTTEEGVMDLHGAVRVTQLGPPLPTFTYKAQHASLPTERVILEVDRGLPWKDALTVLNESSMSSKNGFYRGRSEIFGHRSILLALQKNATSFRIARPNIGFATAELSESDLFAKYTAISDRDYAQSLWNETFERTARECLHGFNCKVFKTTGYECQFGRRCYTLCLLTGSVLAHMNALENTLQRFGEAMQLPKHERFLRVMRVNVHKILLNSNVTVYEKNGPLVVDLMDEESTENVTSASNDNVSTHSKLPSEVPEKTMDKEAPTTIKRIIGLRFPLCLLEKAEAFGRVQYEQELLSIAAKDPTRSQLNKVLETSSGCTLSWSVEPQRPVISNLLKKATTSPKKITHFFKPSCRSTNDDVWGSVSQQTDKSDESIIITDDNTSEQKLQKHLSEPLHTLKRRTSQKQNVQVVHPPVKRQASVAEMFEKISSQIKTCPICKYQFPPKTSNGEINDHIDDCVIE